MQMQGGFDATGIAPQQGGVKHPVGKGFDAIITGTAIEATKENTGGMYVVEFTTAAGSIINRYNLWNPNAQTVEIAQKQLSALCHATGVFKLDWQNEGAALRNARCKIDVGEQPDKNDTTKIYSRIDKIYDVNGNEPGKPATNQPQMQPQTTGQVAPAAAWVQPQGGPASQQQPMQQQPGGGWAPQPGQQAPQAQQGQAWQPPAQEQQPQGQPQQQWSQQPQQQGGAPGQPSWTR